MIDVFSTHLPAASVSYCRQLWQQYQFTFKVTKPRRTRLGDFRVLPFNRTQITVNANLNPYAFLITYIHEVAHADVNHRYQAQRRSRVQPHGKAWQQAFQRLMLPVMNETVFPAVILQPLRSYMQKPAATTYANPALMIALRGADNNVVESLPANRVLLRDVAEGHQFQFAKKTYIRGTLRRTRVVCKEISSGRSYAILAHAWVEVE